MKAWMTIFYRMRPWIAGISHKILQRDDDLPCWPSWCRRELGPGTEPGINTTFDAAISKCCNRWPNDTLEWFKDAATRNTLSQGHQITINHSSPKGWKALVDCYHNYIKVAHPSSVKKIAWPANRIDTPSCAIFLRFINIHRRSRVWQTIVNEVTSDCSGIMQVYVSYFLMGGKTSCKESKMLRTDINGWPPSYRSCNCATKLNRWSVRLVQRRAWTQEGKCLDAKWWLMNIKETSYIRPETHLLDVSKHLLLCSLRRAASPSRVA